MNNITTPTFAMPRWVFVGLISLLTLTVFNPAHAAENYNIEVIVFENYTQKAWTEEVWPADVEQPSTQNSVSLSQIGSAPLGIGQAPKNLTQVVSKMSGSQGYKILFHQAWSQTAGNSSKSPSVIINAPAQTGSQLNGTVKLYKTRFAHVAVDLTLDKIIPTRIRDDFARHQKISANLLPTHWRFNLKDARKIKPGELHYIDHPQFGVLVQITPKS
ncbi:CsiV family protein [Thiomicrorhabdus aquaedulcis]|uniref:CsiV family protein n=1 Tax=Thiomicrorhabdus aquaedulcis TaxID=2211106 RepID=UPI000FDA95D0|nr:CsiV family protein [Thiomicrorhabdus aquaedulcis]